MTAASSPVVAKLCVGSYSFVLIVLVVCFACSTVDASPPHCSVVPAGRFKYANDTIHTAYTCYRTVAPQGVPLRQK
jgi:hypothetical protein